jgi:hypothetical protein
MHAEGRQLDGLLAVGPTVGCQNLDQRVGDAVARRLTLVEACRRRELADLGERLLNFRVDLVVKGDGNLLELSQVDVLGGVLRLGDRDAEYQWIQAF